jgi:cytosine/adenosine deaminase-related metal-dependent hydrolase
MTAPGIVRAGRVLTAPGHEAPLGPTAIHLEKGRIARLESVDPGSLTPEEAGSLAMPAPADAHDHGRGLRTLAYGAADGPLELWLPALARQPRVDPYLCAAVAFGRMAEGGICAANHCHNTQDPAALLAEAEAVSRAARDVGIAVAFALPFFDRNPAVYGDLDALLATLDPADRHGLAAQAAALRPLAANMALAEQIAALEHDGFRLQYCPVGPQWATHETLAAIAEASAATGRRVHMHLLETERQRQWADAHYPQGLIPFLDTLGLLTPRLTVAHAVWLRPDECALLAERGVTVSINVSSNMRLRSGGAPLDAMRAAGLHYGIGLDGASFDDDEDMLREMRLVRHVHALAKTGAPSMTPAEIFDAALVTGRRTILGDDGGGRIMPGAPADLALLDFAAMSRDCIHDDLDEVDLLLGRMTARHLSSLFVAGREVVRHGRCVTVDLSALEQRLTDEARAAYYAAPPDLKRIARLQEGIAGFYARGNHCCP